MNEEFSEEKDFFGLIEIDEKYPRCKYPDCQICGENLLYEEVEQ
jgi:hypothetical protein